MAQTYENHRRWNVLFHFVASPITWGFAAYSLVRAWGESQPAPWFQALYAIGIAVGVTVSRSMALTLQNRVIRLEARLRLREVLPPPLAARIPELSLRQLVALRFAGDAELPALVQRTLAGEFARPRDIKRAITDWQGDTLRV